MKEPELYVVIKNDKGTWDYYTDEVILSARELAKAHKMGERIAKQVIIRSRAKKGELKPYKTKDDMF